MNRLDNCVQTFINSKMTADSA